MLFDGKNKNKAEPDAKGGSGTGGKGPADPTATAAPEPNPNEPDPNEGPGKGKAFFDRARTVAATGNYDFAIAMYIEGLFREPFNIDEHKALREVAMRRKISGGKTAGGGILGGLTGGPKPPYKGKTPKEALLNNESTLAKDVGNIPAMLAMLRNADLLKLTPLVIWIAPILREANRTTKTPKVEIYTELAETLDKNGEPGRACEAINLAAILKPNDPELASKANYYAAQETMKRGKYGEAESFKDSIKDVQKTKDLLQEENLAKSEEYRRKILEETRAAYEANPTEIQVITKYANALRDMEEEEYENKAVEVLLKAYEVTRIYRLKVAADDVHIRQAKRNFRIMREAAKADPQDKGLLLQLDQLNKDRIAQELKIYQERAEHLPTDMAIKYELGCRYYESKRFDEAIVAFQEAQNNPKHRVDALHLLGRSFLIQGMKPEAIETLKRSIDEYDLANTNDKKSKELHYWYARALEDNGNFGEADVIYSRVVQWEMGFADAKKRLDAIRGRNRPS